MKTLSDRHLTTLAADERRQRMQAFLDRYPIGTLSTVSPDGDPHAAVVYFSVDDAFNIGFMTKRDTRKFDNLTYNKRAMLVVYEASTQTTVQVAGTVEEIRDDTEAQSVFKRMLEISRATGRGGTLPPISKLHAGQYVAMRLRPVQVRMAVFSSTNPAGYELYETIELGT